MYVCSTIIQGREKQENSNDGTFRRIKKAKRKNNEQRHITINITQDWKRTIQRKLTINGRM